MKPADRLTFTCERCESEGSQEDLAHIPGSTTHQTSRRLKRLRLHGVVKRVPATFKYHLTDFGRRIIIGSLALKEMTLVPTVSRAAAR